MKNHLLRSFCLTIALGVIALPAKAGQGTLYANIGTGSVVYNCCAGWTVSGTGSIGTSFTAANEFQPTASGSVTQVWLAVGYVSGANSFYIAVDSDSGGLPGAQLAYFPNLSSNQDFGGCCGLVGITGITGLHLSTSDKYWLVVGPMNSSSTTYEFWNFSNSALSNDAYSTDGGISWIGNDIQPQGAIDIIGTFDGTTPEPGSMLLFGSGAVGLAGILRRKYL